jgi:hypothetical protein
VIAARLLPLALLAACLAACSTTPRRDAAPPSADAHEGTPKAPPGQAPRPQASSEDAAAPAAPPDAASWIDPLPTLVLVDLRDDQQARARACLEGRDVSPSATPTTIMAAAECLGAIPAPGHEIRLYRLLVEAHPTAPEAIEAMSRMGTRYEQLDIRAQAAEAYFAYLRHYPKQADARALAQRAVCLARSLGDGARVDDLFTELERLHGGRGFSRPTDDALARLCAPLPPVTPRPPATPPPG